MLHCEPGAQLKQRLLIPFPQFVEDGASGRISKSLEHVAHVTTIGKLVLACQYASAQLHDNGISGNGCRTVRSER